MNYAIEIQNVTKEYKIFSSPKKRLMYSMSRMNRFKPSIFVAADNIDIRIPKGEILGIIGRNGAGKSTLLKLITGVSFPTYGEIKVNGRISSLLELGAGFNPELTGIDNIYFQGNLLGMSHQDIESRIDDILNFADIGDFIYQPVKNYSSGMFARLAFATAIHVDPDILIVDEVLAVGDISFQFKCIEKMKEFAQKGVTIIFVTHSMMSLYRFCERAIWIDKGRVVMDGTVEEVVPRYEDSLRVQETSEKKVEQEQQSTEYIKFKGVQLYQNNNKVDKIKKHIPFEIKFTYSLAQNLTENPYFALSILKTGFNKDSFGLQPMQDKYDLSSKKGEYEITVKVETNYFNNGDYTLYFYIFEKNGVGILFAGDILEFEVVGELNSLGLIDVEHEVIVREV